MNTSRALNKIVRVGKLDRELYGNREHPNIFCKITYADGRLSISGVVGPRRSGNCAGSCGQIDQGFAHRNPDDNDDRYHNLIQPEQIRFARGWTADRWLDFLDIWQAWHLNDARAGCQHQRQLWDAREKIEVVTYKLNAEGHQIRRAAEKEAARAAAAGEVADLTEAGRLLLAIDWYTPTPEPPDADSPLSGLYEVATREIKAAGWVYPHEHAKGLLTRPCPVCGYRYGTEWRREEVPDDVLDFLEGLPDTDITPAWV